jgi:hypothetical protein
MRSVTDNPAASASTTKADKPFAPGASPLRAKHDVVVGDAAVGDPGLGAVEPHMRVAVWRCRHRQRRHIGAGFRLGQRKSRDGFPFAHARKIAALEIGGAVKRDRAGAEPLHREGEIGKTVMEGEDLARKAERAHIELRVRSAEFGGHHRGQKSGLAQGLHPRAAGRVDVVMRQLVERRLRPARQLRSEAPVTVIEERARSASRRAACQLPSNTGFCFAAKAR